MKMITHFECVYQNGQQVVEANYACGAPFNGRTTKHTYDLRKVTCVNCLDRLVQIASETRDRIAG
ncbi:MAG: hypothetical protein ACYDHY_07005 [Acidiferrobacterales bacterium]